MVIQRSPSFALGVGGHQNLGDEKTQHFVAAQFRSLLLTYQQQKTDLILYSALARGADQLFVQIALELGVPVEIVVPCTEYENIFPSEKEKQDYIRYLNAAQATHQLSSRQCSDDAFLAAEHWIIDQSNLLILAWNGQPSQGRGGTGDMASYARYVGCPFIHIDTRHHLVKTYGTLSPDKQSRSMISPKQEFAVAKQQVYQGSTLIVNQYHVHMPDGQELVRDVMERPESILILPISQPGIVLLIEEYDFGAGVWQVTLPGGKVESASFSSLEEQAQKELRQEIGYQARTLEKLITFYSHPGYISHRVHVFVAYDLQWNPLEQDHYEEIRVQTYSLKDALQMTTLDQRCDPEAALVLWLYTQQNQRIIDEDKK